MPLGELTSFSQEGPEIPAYYFNGFALGMSNSDVNTILMLDGQPLVKLNMSFTMAKTLVKLLGDAMAHLERVTGREIMRTDQIAEGLQQLSEGPPK